MKIAIMQPYLFPYIGYWQLVDAVDVFVIYDDVAYIKKGYINRNSILVNGEKYMFTLQLLGASQNKFIKDINVGGNAEKILSTIKQNYKKSPYFNNVYPLLEKVFSFKERNLARFLGNSLDVASRFLNIDTKLIYSSDIEKDDKLSGQEKIIEICKALQATAYVNSIGGKSLYDEDSFLKNDLELRFLKPEILKYNQFGAEFVPCLSVIDVMMFNSEDSMLKIIKDYSEE